MPVNSLTSVKFLNWVCSRFLAVGFPSLPSGSEEFLKIRAAVAMAFSRSEPFPRAVREEMHNNVAYIRNNLSLDYGAISSRELWGIGWKVHISVALSLGSLAPILEWEVGVSDPESLNSGGQKFLQEQLGLVELGLDLPPACHVTLGKHLTSLSVGFLICNFVQLFNKYK